MSHVFKEEGKKYFEKSVSLLDNVPKYLVGCVIQKRIYQMLVYLSSRKSQVHNNKHFSTADISMTDLVIHGLQ